MILARGLLLAASIAATLSAQDRAAVVFVDGGQPIAVHEVGDRWTEGDGFVRGEGVGGLLRAERDAGAGDVVIHARITLEEIDGTAASLVLGGGNHFGFDGRGARLFVEGPLFGGLSQLGPTADRIRAGIAFDAVVERRGRSLTLRIDGEVVHRAEVDAGRALGAIALRPWRAAMRVHQFEATGDLVDRAPSVLDDALWVGGRGGHHTYRIPALVVTRSGTLLAFCEGRHDGGGDSGDIDLLLRRSTDGGETWSAPEVVFDDGANTCGNPCPVVDHDSGDVVLLSTWNDGRDHERAIIAGESRDTRRVFVLRSEDDGRTWSVPTEITRDVKDDAWTWYATGPGNGIQVERGAHRGRLVVPCDHIEAESKRYLSHCILSDDGGRTWHRGAATPRDAVNECAVVELADGSLLLNMRNYDRQKRSRQVARSDDGGETWTAQRHDAALIEPICQASLIRVGRGDAPEVLLFSNPASTMARERMTVRSSTDDGQTWTGQFVLHQGPSAYSSLAALPGGAVFCLFEAGDMNAYQAIVLRRVRFDDER